MLKPYSELVKVDVTKYCKKRDGMDYLNWAKCVELLHEHGAETVYFEPMVNEHGSSLFMSDQVFGSGKEGDPTNRCYEVGVTVHVDDNTWEFRGPLMNGKNPVKDNSLTQQRVWNAQTRLFVKCIAIHTGLGFHLWVKSEENEQDDVDEFQTNKNKHSLLVIKRRIEELVTAKMQQTGFSLDDLAQKIGIADGDTLRGYFSYFTTLSQMERNLRQL